MGPFYSLPISGMVSDASLLPAHCWKSLFCSRLWSMESPYITFIIPLRGETDHCSMIPAQTNSIKQEIFSSFTNHHKTGWNLFMSSRCLFSPWKYSFAPFVVPFLVFCYIISLLCQGCLLLFDGNFLRSFFSVLLSTCSVSCCVNVSVSKLDLALLVSSSFVCEMYLFIHLRYTLTLQEKHFPTSIYIINGLD